jgi:hypothetical protein
MAFRLVFTAFSLLLHREVFGVQRDTTTAQRTNILFPKMEIVLTLFHFF